MHAVVMENLEEYLSGLLEPAELREVEAHLSTVPLCREEVRDMQEVSLLFGSLRPEERSSPSPEFYARVVAQVHEQRKRSESLVRQSLRFWISPLAGGWCLRRC